MNKARIERVLRKEGFEQIRFYNPDGALGFRPDDSYFSGKEVALARLKNWEMQELSTLDVAPAVKQACEVGFDRVQMIQDDKNRWALYIKPENESGYSVYPDKEDVNRFFPHSSRRWTTSTKCVWNWRTSITLLLRRSPT